MTPTISGRRRHTTVEPCSRHRPFRSRTTAANAAAVLRCLGRALEPRRCPSCNHWHLTALRSA